MVTVAQIYQRHPDIEERLEQAHRDQKTLKAKLSDVMRERDSQAKELQDAQNQLVTLMDSVPRVDACCQANIDERTPELERILLRSQEQLRLAQTDLATKEAHAVRLREELNTLTSRANATTEGGLGSAKLAIAPREELTSTSKQSQVCQIIF